ncbi:hypothetical protein QMZ05_12475 [Bradyrhizobium sp. INPA03-11B]|uniref:hypothetical protein n=1 Tax=Bradyrhizobium sp. INPA03-11B TaxID=418598 RepID=UPI0033902EAC
MVDNVTTPIPSGATFKAKDYGANGKAPAHILFDSTEHEILGTTADIAATQTDATPVSAISIWKQISKSIQAVAAALASALAVTQSGTWTVATNADGTTGSAVPAKGLVVQGSDGTNAHNLAVTTGGALKVDNSALTSFGAGNYKTVAASATDTVLGTTGAAGDYLQGLLIVPATTSPGAVSIKDGSGSSITVFTGGSSSVSNLVSFFIPLGLISGSGAWKVTTGANVSVIGCGKFT